MEVDPKIQKKATLAIFGTVLGLALVNIPQHPSDAGIEGSFIPNILVCITRIISAIVCPLIMIVLPGSFYHYTKFSLTLFNQDYEYKCCAKTMVTSGIIFGLLLLPIFLTMASLFMLNQ
jgi:hypothetical protein